MEALERSHGGIRLGGEDTVGVRVRGMQPRTGQEGGSGGVARKVEDKREWPGDSQHRIATRVLWRPRLI